MGSKGKQKEEVPSNLLFVWREAHSKELSSVACSAGGDQEVGKREAWTPQPIMCGIQDSKWGSSLGDITGPKIEEKFTELVDQLRVQCLRETAVIPQRSTQGSAGYDIKAACSCVIPSKGKGVVQTGLAISFPSGVYARIAPRSRLAVKKFIDMGAGVISSDYRGELG